jgi:hypothetical protein
LHRQTLTGRDISAYLGQRRRLHSAERLPGSLFSSTTTHSASAYAVATSPAARICRSSPVQSSLLSHVRSHHPHYVPIPHHVRDFSVLPLSQPRFLRHWIRDYPGPPRSQNHALYHTGVAPPAISSNLYPAGTSCRRHPTRIKNRYARARSSVTCVKRVKWEVCVLRVTLPNLSVKTSARYFLPAHHLRDARCSGLDEGRSGGFFFGATY